MELTEAGKILTLEDLRSAEWKERWMHSLETEDSEAQESLINFILNLGGAREDVFEFLLSPRFHSTASVASVRTLLCYAAPVEWLELSVEALNRDAIAGVMYVNEITEAFKTGIPLEEVRHFLRNSGTAFEMCQYRIRYPERKAFCEGKAAESDRTGLRDRMAGSGKAEACISDMQHNMAEIVSGAVMSAMKAFMGEMQGGYYTGIRPNVAESEKAELHDRVTENEKAELHDRVTENEGAELHDRVTGSEGAELHDRVTGSEGTELHDRVTGSEEAELHDRVTGSDKTELCDNLTKSDEEVPDFPDGKEVIDNRNLVTELEKAESQYGKRVSFFQMLLNRHMRKAFSKLDEEAQVGKIFEIMIGRKYEKGRILAIRRLMNGGMTKDFIFSLLEKDLPLEELTDLCHTLLDSDADSWNEMETGKEENQDENMEEAE